MVLLNLLLFLLLTTAVARDIVIASVYPIYYPLIRMAEKNFDVDVLIKAQADPHHYELKPEDIKKLEKARVFLYLGVEGWEKRVARRIPKDRAISLEKGIDFIRVGKHIDPHLWLSPKAYAQLVERIRDSLIKIDPSGEEYYRKKSEEFLKSLKSLDEEYRRALSACQSKTLVITHLSTAYLGRDYGLEVVGLRGVHAEEEPRPSEIKNMLDRVRKNKVKTIFSEVGYDERLALRLARETGAKVISINTSLFPEEREDDYFSIMRRNLKRLSEGLNCQIR